MESEDGIVWHFLICFALIAATRFVSTIFGVADSEPGTEGVAGVAFPADFLAGAVFFRAVLRVLMLTESPPMKETETKTKLEFFESISSEAKP